MNKVVTSKEEILEVSRKMILEKGVSSFSMRTVAGKCGVAVGSIYNYYPSKTELLSDTIESIWNEIFAPFYAVAEFDSILTCVSKLFDTMKEGERNYPAFFSVHSLSFASEEKKFGKARMFHFFDGLEQKLADCLQKDEKVRPDAFENGLTREEFAGYIFTLLVSIRLGGQENCQSLLCMIENCVY